MFHNELLKKSTEFASKFKMPYLFPQFNDCDYCELLKKIPHNSRKTHNWM